MPYQTLIASVLHKVTGRLAEPLAAPRVRARPRSQAAFFVGDPGAGSERMWLEAP